MSSKIGRIVNINGVPYAVVCDDGNGDVGVVGDSNMVTLTPCNEDKFKAVGEDLAPGFYRVRVARLMAGYTTTNEDGARRLVAVIAHPNSKWVGATIGEALAATGTDGTRKGLSTRGALYIGQRVGGAASPLGWTLVYWDGTFPDSNENADEGEE